MNQLKLILSNLTVGYGKKAILSGICFDFTPGIYTITGASGAGKTTLLRTVAGLQKPVQGKVILEHSDDQSGDWVRRYNPTLYMLHQHRTNFPWMKVVDNVTLPLKLRGDETPYAKAGEMLQAVGLYHHSDKYPAQLSGGQQQRLALARTLVTEPEVVLLDEPFASLDTTTADDIASVIRDYQRRTNSIVILVSHTDTITDNLIDISKWRDTHGKHL